MNHDHYSRSYTVQTNGTVNLTETTVSDINTASSEVFEALNYMDINGWIYLHPGTEGVQKEWHGTGH